MDAITDYADPFPPGSRKEDPMLVEATFAETGQAQESATLSEVHDATNDDMAQQSAGPLSKGDLVSGENSSTDQDPTEEKTKMEEQRKFVSVVTLIATRAVLSTPVNTLAKVELHTMVEGMEGTSLGGVSP